MTRTMRKWTARLAGGMIALTGLGMVGCKHQLFTEPADAPVLRRPNIPPTLETHPHAPITPPPPAAGTDPATVLDFKRKPRPISLKEAVAVASEQGNVGAGAGQGQDALQLQSTGRAISGDTIKAFVLDPATAAAEVERSLSRFDARWISSMSWSKQDQATLTLQQSFSNGDNAAFTTTLAKPLPTGGVAGITTSINYLSLSNPPPVSSGFVALSTSYTPRVQFVFEQPLLQGFGVEANQLLNTQASSLLIQGFRTTGQGTEGILIARMRQEQARTQFDVVLNQLLVNVEVAYWNLYAEYANLAAQQDGLLAAFDALVYIRERDIAGVEVVRTQLPLYEGQYHQFYQRVVEARGRVLEADRVLRGLMGMRSDDGTVFTPTDEPVRTPFTFDYQAAYREGLETRPEVIIARQDLKVQQLNHRAQQLGRMPDLRLFSSYDVNGLGGRLTGDVSNALSSLSSNQFNSWQVGLRLDVPLGFRDANALVRQAQLALWRSWYTLSDAERKVYEGLVQAKRQLDQAYVLIETNRRQKAAARRQVDIIVERVRAGAIADSAQFLQLAQAQQNLATFQAAEYRAVADYNAALARIEFAKGTSQRYNNVSVADGPLPGFVQARAADHFRARQAALKLREQPADGPTGGFDFLQPEQMPHPADVMTAPGMPVPPPIPAPAPGPGLTPPAKDTLPAGEQPGKTPVSVLKPYDKWETAPADGGKANPPVNLPPLPSLKGTPSAQPQPGGFTQNGTLTLPPKRLTGDEK